MDARENRKRGTCLFEESTLQKENLIDDAVTKIDLAASVAPYMNKPVILDEAVGCM